MMESTEQFRNGGRPQRTRIILFQRLEKPIFGLDFPVRASTIEELAPKTRKMGVTFNILRIKWAKFGENLALKMLKKVSYWAGMTD